MYCASSLVRSLPSQIGVHQPIFSSWQPDVSIRGCVRILLQIQGEGTKAAATNGGGSVASLRSMASQSIKYRGMAGTLATITREEGARALYNGLAPGLQRQLAFASIRIGLYDSVKHFYLNMFKG